MDEQNQLQLQLCEQLKVNSDLSIQLFEYREIQSLLCAELETKCAEFDTLISSSLSATVPKPDLLSKNILAAKNIYCQNLHSDLRDLQSKQTVQPVYKEMQMQTESTTESDRIKFGSRKLNEQIIELQQQNMKLTVNLNNTITFYQNKLHSAKYQIKQQQKEKETEVKNEYETHLKNKDKQQKHKEKRSEQDKQRQLEQNALIQYLIHNADLMKKATNAMKTHIFTILREYNVTIPISQHTSLQLLMYIANSLIKHKLVDVKIFWDHIAESIQSNTEQTVMLYKYLCEHCDQKNTDVINEGQGTHDFIDQKLLVISQDTTHTQSRAYLKYMKNQIEENNQINNNPPQSTENQQKITQNDIPKISEQTETNNVQQIKTQNSPKKFLSNIQINSIFECALRESLQHYNTFQNSHKHKTNQQMVIFIQQLSKIEQDQIFQQVAFSCLPHFVTNANSVRKYFENSFTKRAYEEQE
ncbi:Hypothetical_protein [Hexamita inflata]|uniref:Hypothetical_protein n=1 Tax=Hexamita inflata TaxID=28002 RepID=A0AA86UJH0_9EUKA|nr:Hypothetical protein HINF_LOCUS48270 [Hexamita inflata]